MPVWLTLLAGTAITVAPQFIAVMPPQVQGIVTAIFAMGASLYHLYQPSPSQPVK